MPSSLDNTCLLPTPPAAETKPNTTTPVSVSFEHHPPNILVFTASPLAALSRPSTPSSFVVANRPTATRSQSQSAVVTEEVEPLSSPPAYSSSSSSTPVASSSNPPTFRNEKPKTRTWRIEFAMEGQNDNEDSAPTPYTIKVFIRFTAGAITGVIGFLASLVALLIVFAFPSLRPRGPEAATYGAGGVGVWSPGAVKVRRNSIRRSKPAPPVNNAASTSHSGSSTPTTVEELPQAALERRVTFQLRRSDTGSAQSGNRISTTLVSSPLSQEYPTTNTISINSPITPHYLEESSNAVASGSRLMESRTNTRSPAPSQYSEESSVNGKEKDGGQSGGGQKKFMRRFMRRTAKKDEGSTKVVSEDEREGSGYTSAPPSQPSTPIDREVAIFSPVSPPIVEEIISRPSRRLSLKLPGFKRRSIVASNPIPVSHPLLVHAQTMPTSPESIGNASISASESGMSHSSGITESSSGGSIPLRLGLTAPPPSPFPSRAGKSRHAKSSSFSSISSKGPPPSRPSSLLWKRDAENEAPKGFVVQEERSRKLSLDDRILEGAGPGGAGALQLQTTKQGDDPDPDTISDTGPQSRHKAVMGQRVASDSAVTVSSTSTSVSGKAKRRSVGGIPFRSSSKPPVTARPSRHEVTRRYHADSSYTRELSHSDTEVFQ
ncbi:hypothetical protein FRB97_000772 [Tulasnella sp. 331]|nr:hypothetical protein FRB97_000772 [Tulasnella sp. 331]